MVTGRAKNRPLRSDRYITGSGNYNHSLAVTASAPQQRILITCTIYLQTIYLPTIFFFHIFYLNRANKLDTIPFLLTRIVSGNLVLREISNISEATSDTVSDLNHQSNAKQSNHISFKISLNSAQVNGAKACKRTTVIMSSALTCQPFSAKIHD